MKVIWLIKSSEETDSRYIEIIKKEGHICKSLPALAFKFVNQSVIEDALNTPEKHSGIVFTSPRAVEALDPIYCRLTLDKHKEWLKNKLFAIGETTGNAVRKMMTTDKILGENCHTSKNLFPLIVKETVEFDKPLLIPGGNLKRDELPRLLASENRDFRSIICYETLPHPELNSNIEKFISENDKDNYLVFFSPSCVNYIQAVLNSVQFCNTELKCIAIGPTTNAALAENNLNVIGVCPSPTPEGLLHTLKGLL